MESQMESQIGSAQVCLATLFPFHHFLDDTDFFFADFLLFFHSVTLCIQSGTNVKKLETVT